MLIIVLLIGVLATNMRVDFSFAPPVLAVVAVFFVLSLRYRKLGDTHLVAALEGCALLMFFSTGYMLATYLVPEHSPWGLWDEQFAAFDEALGLTADDIVRWSRSTPALDATLARIYNVFYYHYALIALYAAGIRRDPVRAFTVLANMFVCALIGLLLFGLFPSLNAVWFYGHEDIHNTARLVQHLQMLDAGTFQEFSMNGAQGLVQFPSFHVALALLLCWDLRNEHRYILIAGCLWTSAIVLSAVTTGGHYVIDVWGGVGIAAAAVAVVDWLSTKPEGSSIDPEACRDGSDLPESGVRTS